MQKQRAGVSGYLVNAALESEEADREGFQPDPGGCSLQNSRTLDNGTPQGSHKPPGAGKPHWRAGAAHLGQTEKKWDRNQLVSGAVISSPGNTGNAILSQPTPCTTFHRLDASPVPIPTAPSVLTLSGALEKTLSQWFRNQNMEDFRMLNRKVKTSF